MTDVFLALAMLAPIAGVLAAARWGSRWEDRADTADHHLRPRGWIRDGKDSE